MHRVFMILGISLASIRSFSASLEASSDEFRKMVDVSAIRGHQQVLDEIASKNSRNRSAGSSGYAQSVDYIFKEMQAYGYIVRKQDFTIRLQKDAVTPVLQKNGKSKKTFVFGSDFASMTNEGQAQVEAEIEAVDLIIPSRNPNHSSSGCEEEDFLNFKPGNIALIQRGTCSFELKAQNAQKAGAAGAIIFNEGNPDRTDLFSGRIDLSGFPVLATSYQVGEELRGEVLHGPTKTEASIKVDVRVEARTVQNVIAESALGDGSRVITVGAHLDSVQEGPGINDNGSGSSTNLEIAKQYMKLSVPPKNKLRFIWFAAEELGLLGSDFYVKSLSKEEKSQIMAMLNFDMLSSQNYVRFVYDGDNSGRTEIFGQKGPEGSAQLEKIFLDYFASQNLPNEPTAFNGRSDYGPFIKAGIPAGGLFSGAEGLKSARLQRIYGGEAGRPFDSCYHQSCDNMNTNGQSLATKSLDELSDAAAHAVFVLSQTSEVFRLPQEEEVLPMVEFEYQGNRLVK